MNAHAMAHTAYAQSAAPIRTDRGNEYEAFARITAALKSAITEAKGNFPALVRALNDNHRLWTLMGTSVADSGNQLPKALRAEIFYLAQFSLQHIAKVLRREAEPDILVEINTAIMRGLRGSGAK